MNKAIFLDRDGVINIDKHYIYKPEDFEFTNRAVEAIRLLNSMDYKVIVVSNQSGIARGYFSEDDVCSLHNYVDVILAKEHAKIDAWYICPHLPEITGECECRKPKIGLINQAIKDFDINTSTSWLVGDKQSDVKCAANAGLKAVLISSKYAFDDIDKDCRLCANLYEFVKEIREARL